MAKICASGFKISNADQKAVEHCLLVSPRKWAEDALKGMINRAVKTILEDWLDDYKAAQAEKISTDLAVIIPAIIALPNFRSYKLSSSVGLPEPIISKKQISDQEIWDGGLDLQEYELAALGAFYEDPEAQLHLSMENKINYCRKNIVREFEDVLLNDPTVTEMPAHADDLIEQETEKSSYKNRVQREAVIDGN